MFPWYEAWPAPNPKNFISTGASELLVIDFGTGTVTPAMVSSYDPPQPDKPKAKNTAMIMTQRFNLSIGLSIISAVLSTTSMSDDQRKKLDDYEPGSGGIRKPRKYQTMSRATPTSSGS